MLRLIGAGALRLASIEKLGVTLPISSDHSVACGDTLWTLPELQAPIVLAVAATAAGLTLPGHVHVGESRSPELLYIEEYPAATTLRTRVLIPGEQALKRRTAVKSFRERW